jgi:hypothetical protein
MTRRIILHCGLPKTGTSALQVQFAQSRLALLDNFDIDYLKDADFEKAATGKITSGNGGNLAKAYLPPSHPASQSDHVDEFTQDVMAKIKQTESHVLLSSEFFSSIPERRLAALIDTLSEQGAVELVFFTRNQLSRLASAYMQQVKRHGEVRFPDAFFTKWENQKAGMLYFKRFTRLAFVCEKAKLHVRPYENAKDHDNGLLGLFLNTIGIADTAKLDVEDTPVNLSPSPLELRLLLEVNRLQPRAGFSDMLVEASAQAGRSQPFSQHLIVPPSVRSEAKAVFDEDNQKFFREFVGTENQYPIDVEGDYIDLSQLTFEANDVMFILSGLLARIDRRLAKLERG